MPLDRDTLDRFCDLYSKRWPEDFRHRLNFGTYRDGKEYQVVGFLTDRGGAYDTNADDFENAKFIVLCLERLDELDWDGVLHTHPQGFAFYAADWTAQSIASTRAEVLFTELLKALEVEDA